MKSCQLCLSFSWLTFRRPQESEILGLKSNSLGPIGLDLENEGLWEEQKAHFSSKEGVLGYHCHFTFSQRGIWLCCSEAFVQEKKLEVQFSRQSIHLWFTLNPLYFKCVLSCLVSEVRVLVFCIVKWELQKKKKFSRMPEQKGFEKVLGKVNGNTI